MGFQDVIRWFMPREDHFFDYLERQAAVAQEGAQILCRFKESGARAEQLTQVMSDLEHRGDEVVHELEDALARTFVTPLDREDIHKLSTELDNVIDLMNLAVRSCHLFGVDQPTKPMLALIDTLVESTRVIAEAIPKLRKRSYGHLVEDARTMRRLEKQGDQIFRGALLNLFHDDKIDAKSLLKEKEVLEDLEAAIDECDHIAETLSNLAVKHG